VGYRVVLTEQAARDARRLPRDAARRCRNALTLLQENPARGQPLKGEWKGLYRYRVGDFRIIYRIRRRELVVIVIAIGHRREVYRRAPRRPT
jgi:mRNA interferase RelE/StbE